MIKNKFYEDMAYREINKAIDIQKNYKTKDRLECFMRLEIIYKELEDMLNRMSSSALSRMHKDISDAKQNSLMDSASEFACSEDEYAKVCVYTRVLSLISKVLYGEHEAIER